MNKKSDENDTGVCNCLIAILEIAIITILKNIKR